MHHKYFIFIFHQTFYPGNLGNTSWNYFPVNIPCNKNLLLLSRHGFLSIFDPFWSHRRVSFVLYPIGIVFGSKTRERCYCDRISFDLEGSGNLYLGSEPACSNFRISIAHRIKNPLRRTSKHIAIIYFQTFTQHIVRMVQE